MTVSVIVPTYNGAKKLPGILSHLLEQSILPNEIVVVVDGSTDNTREVLNEFVCQTPLLKVVWQTNAGRSVVRNRGAREAKGALLIFFDDDMLPGPKCIENHIAHHINTRGSIVTGAQVDSCQKVTDFQMFKHYLSIKWAKGLLKYEGNSLPEGQVFITAANFSVQREIFMALGGFEERLTDTEDFDFAVRASKKGIPVYYNHNAFAWHNDKVTCRSYINRLREYYKANKKLAELRPWLVKEGFLNIAKSPKGLKSFFFRFFCSKYWIQQIDAPSWVMLLPQTIRYKFYSYVITANGVYFPESVDLN